MRVRKKASKPGSPPSAHTRILKDWILSVIDDRTSSIVIGPKKTNQVFFNGDRKPVRGTVPQVLNEGGEIHIFERFSKSQNEWVRIDLRRRRPAPGTPLRLRKVQIAARPFTAPALAEVISNKKLEQAFKDIM